MTNMTGFMVLELWACENCGKTYESPIEGLVEVFHPCGTASWEKKRKFKKVEPFEPYHKSGK